jgi:hypothetical protein
LIEKVAGKRSAEETERYKCCALFSGNIKDGKAAISIVFFNFDKAA